MQQHINNTNKSTTTSASAATFAATTAAQQRWLKLKVFLKHVHSTFLSAAEITDRKKTSSRIGVWSENDQKPKDWIQTQVYQNKRTHWAQYLSSVWFTRFASECLGIKWNRVRGRGGGRVWNVRAYWWVCVCVCMCVCEHKRKIVRWGTKTARKHIWLGSAHF